MSALASPTPVQAAGLVTTGVSAPQTQPVSPLTDPGFTSPLAAPLMDPSFIAATQTTEAFMTETAVALLFTPTATGTDTPTPTDTPMPTDTPSVTPTPTDTPTPTITQRPLESPTVTIKSDGAALFSTALNSAVAAAGWIWFAFGMMLFFVTAGVVTGLGIHNRSRRPIAYDPYKLMADKGAEGSGATPSPSANSANPSNPPQSSATDDHWPASLP